MPQTLIQQIESRSLGTFKLASKKKRGAYRLLLVDKAANVQEQIKQMLSSVTVERIVHPTEPDSKSSKYNTYYVSDGTNTIIVVFGSGANKGTSYEDTVYQALNDKTGPEWDSISAWLTANGINTDSIKHVVKRGYEYRKTNVKKTIEDIGNVVSDIDLILSEPTMVGSNPVDILHISLKNKSGYTIANFGYDGVGVDKTTGMFVSKKSTNPSSDMFLETALGISKQRLVSGLTAYKLKDPTLEPTFKLNREDVDANPNLKLTQQFLASQVGYGYVIAKQTTSGTLKAVGLLAPTDSLILVGNVQSVVVRYPYFKSVGASSKQATALIKTSTGLFHVEVRATDGTILPKQLNVRMIGVL